MFGLGTPFHEQGNTESQTGVEFLSYTLRTKEILVRSKKLKKRGSYAWKDLQFNINVKRWHVPKHQFESILIELLKNKKLKKGFRQSSSTMCILRISCFSEERLISWSNFRKTRKKKGGGGKKSLLWCWTVSLITIPGILDLICIL